MSAMDCMLSNRLSEGAQRPGRVSSDKLTTMRAWILRVCVQPRTNGRPTNPQPPQSFRRSADALRIPFHCPGVSAETPAPAGSVPRPADVYARI